MGSEIDKWDEQAKAVIESWRREFPDTSHPGQLLFSQRDRLHAHVATALRLVHAVQPGYVRDSGGEYKVLGVLPMTADGCVACGECDVFHPQRPRCGVPKWSDEDGWLAEFDETGAGDWKYHPVLACYSTKELAAAALAAQGGEKKENSK